MCRQHPLAPDVEAHDVPLPQSDQTIQDSPHSSFTAIISVCLFSVLSLSLFFWLIIIAKSDVNGISDETVKSSLQRKHYFIRGLLFPLPTFCLWGCLTAASMAFVFVSLDIFFLIKHKVGTPTIMRIATAMKEATTIFWVKQCQSVLIITIPVFILLAVLTDCNIAIAYLMGVALVLTLGVFGVSIATRGNVRIASAAHENIETVLFLSFRSSAIIGLSVLSLAVAAPAAVYIIFDDVSVLFGFAAGVSLTVIIPRIAAALLQGAVTLDIESYLPEDDPRNLEGALVSAGNTLGSLLGDSFDLLESFVLSVVATAVLGAFLPFPYNDPFALCVFNHLYIDKICAPLSYPETLSYATSICEMSISFDYPHPGNGQSNATFVALPFAIAIIGVIVGTVFTRTLPFPQLSAHRRQTSTKAHSNFRWSLKLRLLLASIFIALGAAALCWTFFGARSTFQKLQGFGSHNNLPVYQIANTNDPCRPPSQASDGELLSLPQGNWTYGKYRPLSPLGFQYSPPNQTSWRLFLCIIIGLALGLAISILAEYFSRICQPTAGLSEPCHNTAGVVILQGLAVGVMSAILSLIIILAAIFGSYILYGTYGVGIASVGMLSVLPIVIAAGLHTTFGRDATAIAQVDQHPGVPELLQRLITTGSKYQIGLKAFANCSALIAAFLLLVVLVQQTGLVPSPPELVGRTTSTLPNLLAIRDHYRALLDPSVVGTTFLGILLPYLLAASTLTGLRRVAELVMRGVRHQLELTCTSDDKNISADCRRNVRVSAGWALFETLIPVTVCALTPLIIGFGLGQKALVGMLATLVASAYVLNVTMTNTTHILYARPQIGCVAELVHSSQQALSPSLNALVKLGTIIGILLVPRMRPDFAQGWIGLILLFSALFFTALATVWSNHKQKNSEIETQDRVNDTSPPSRAQSPLDERRPRTDSKAAIPGGEVIDLYPIHATPIAFPVFSGKDIIELEIL